MRAEPSFAVASSLSMPWTERSSSSTARMIDCSTSLGVAPGRAIETVTVADADVRAVYQYLIGSEREAR